CVPTPLDAAHNPDLSYVRSATQSILPHLRRGQLVILESSTYPGTTEEELKPLLESAGLQVGTDVWLAFSPERIDPGQKQFKLHQIPKVVGGITPACTERAEAVYGSVFDQVVLVSSAKAAEMTKLLENCQRFVNISFMNEMLMLCEEMKVDLWEVVTAAGTKPYGFTTYYPGPGIGGHCIPVDPLYLLWKARAFQFDVRFIELAHEVNERMPEFVIRKVKKALASRKPLGQADLLVLGVTYKKDVNDMRESMALPIIEGLLAQGAQVDFYDPYIEQLQIGGRTLQRIRLMDRMLEGHDATLILTDHSGIDYQQVVDKAPLVIDTRNATAHVNKHGNVILL
ncbi:MAG TPA: nucleotide sugar dehydrogenase, partial [Bacilli bacterium]|nr:nucleotide sugar dehydrogenase [Bacilli bacterium]